MLERFYNSRDISVLKGKTLTEIAGMEECSRELIFRCSDGTEYRMYHQQDGDEVVFLSSADIVAGFHPKPDCVLENPFGEDEPEEREAWALDTLLDNAVKQLVGAPITLAERIILDIEYMPPVCKRRPREGIIGIQRTLFLLANAHGVIKLVWTASSDDPMESLDVDFMQTAGDGIWKEDEQ